jgi:hypothetical protein
MKLADIDRVNHLVNELKEMRALIRAAEEAEPSRFELFIESGGESSLRMSAEGASTSHAGGVAVSPAFLDRLRELALAELRGKREGLLTELKALGVDTSDE